MAFEALKERKTVNQIASQFQVHSAQVSQWKKMAKEAMEEAFKSGPKKRACATDGQTIDEQFHHLKGDSMSRFLKIICFLFSLVFLFLGGLYDSMSSTTAELQNQSYFIAFAFFVVSFCIACILVFKYEMKIVRNASILILLMNVFFIYHSNFLSQMFYFAKRWLENK